MSELCFTFVIALSLASLQTRYLSTAFRGAHALCGGWARRFAAGAWLSLVGCGCSDIQAVHLGSCGNHVLEAGEDCDGSTGCASSCHFSCSATQPCPSGWGCDREAGVCRASSGHFRALGLAIDDGGKLSSADLDGDGRDELVFVGAYAPVAASIAFFSSAGEVERSVGLPAASSVAAGDVTGDGLPEVIVGGTSVSAFHSSKSRRLSPLISALASASQSALLLSADVDCDGLRDFLLLDDQHLSLVSPSGTLTRLGDVAVSAARLRELENEARSYTVPAYRAIGRFEGATAKTCEMLALPGASPGQVDIYGSGSGGDGVQRLQTVSYTDDANDPPVRWLFLDMNGDGLDDLLITGSTHNYVSYGLGDGTFHSDPTNLPAPLSRLGDGKVAELEEQGEILAGGSATGEPVQLFSAFGAVEGEPYTNARVLDLTGDDALDVVAVGTARRVEVLRGLSTGHLSGLSLPANGIPSIQDLADFDGDGHTDVLLSEQASLDEAPRTASVLFSEVTNSSSGPTVLAEFAGIDQMVAAYLRDDELGPADGNADIGVLYGAKLAQKNLGFLAGGSDRLLRSPLPVEATGQDQYVTNRVPVLGRFRSAEQRDLLIAEDVESFDRFGARGTTRIIWFSIDLNGTSRLASAPLSAPVLLDYGAAAMDADGDGVDELYLVGPDGLLTVRGYGDALQTSTVLNVPGLEQLRVQDVDGDGKLDLALVGPDELSLLTAGSVTGSSRWHHFSKAQVGCGNAYLNYAFIQADLDPELELALACPYPAILADADTSPPDDFGSGDGSLKICDVDLKNDSLSVASVVSVENSDQFVAGDFNGDGVQDLAGAFTTQLLLLGVPR